jgi:PII-like signaling protein
MKTVTIARTYIKEGDKVQGYNLMQEIFRLLHGEKKVCGVTVFRGVAGFGSKGEVHADDLLHSMSTYLRSSGSTTTPKSSCRASGR